LQCALSRPVKLIDPRCANLRQRYDLVVEAPRPEDTTWWQNCVFGLVEPLLFALADRQNGAVAARAFVYELEGFSWRWGKPAVGIVGLHVRPELRRHGLGRFLLAQILRYVQDQCFELVEVQVVEENATALKLCQGLGFEQADVGRIYQRQE
jgi:GNAT superfamily N-acetyltransferase